MCKRYVHIARCDHTFLLSDDIFDGNVHTVITRTAAGSRLPLNCRHALPDLLWFVSQNPVSVSLEVRCDGRRPAVTMRPVELSVLANTIQRIDQLL